MNATHLQRWVLCASAAIGVSGQVLAQVITVFEPAPGFEYSSARYVSPLGVVVGTSNNSGLYSPQPTRWISAGSPGEMLGRPTVDGGGEPYRCSDDGQVVVGRWLADQNTSTPAMWGSDGNYVALAGPGTVSEANGVSADGSIITGWSATSQGRWMLRWTNGALTQQVGPSFVSGPCSPDGNTAIGVTYTGGSGATLSRWTRAGGSNGSTHTLTQFPASWSNVRAPLAMTPNGDAAIGIAYTGHDRYQSWIWRNGQLADMGVPEGATTLFATGIAASGELVVGTAVIQEQPQAFRQIAHVWTPEIGWQSLSGWLESHGMSFPGWTFQSINSITPDGRTFAGDGRTPMGDYRGFVITIPGPGAATLVVVSLGFACRRRR